MIIILWNSFDIPPPSSGSPAVTAEARQQLHLALILHRANRGGGGSSGYVRRSLHLKIVGGFQAELEQLRASAGFLGEGDAASLRTASQYLDWLGSGNVPDRFQETPAFIDTGGPSIFPRVAPIYRDVSVVICSFAVVEATKNKVRRNLESIVEGLDPSEFTGVKARIEPKG